VDPYINETEGATVNFPIIADPDRKVADLYGMIHPNAADTVTVRSVFIVGPPCLRLTPRPNKYGRAGLSPGRAAAVPWPGWITEGTRRIGR
jgi:AhpC/TSA family